MNIVQVKKGQFLEESRKKIVCTTTLICLQIVYILHNLQSIKIHILHNQHVSVGERSGHISFRGKSAFLKLLLCSLNTLSAAQPKMPFGNLLV